MELRQLHYLLAIVDEGNFTRASEKLFVSQPALSQQIRLLEEEIGTTLLHRAGRQIRLTGAGELLCFHLRRMFGELDAGLEAVRELEGVQRGTLKLGVVQTVNTYLMPKLIAEYRQQYPGIEVQIDELPDPEIIEKLDNGELFLGIGFLPATNPNIEGKVLFDEELVLIAPTSHKISQLQAIAVADLSNYPMVLLSKNFCTRRLWDDCAAQAKIQPHILAEMNSINGILATLPHLDAATVLPKLALDKTTNPKLAAINLYEPTPTRSVGLLWRKNSYLCPASRAFKQLVTSFMPAISVQP
jgi:LysR family transcriptional regulator, cyn operon transcriptional activator